MHTTLGWWDEERIRWYDAAASYSSFHRALTDDIERLIDKNDRILELGCGLGYVSELLCADGYAIRATDKDESAIRSASDRTGLPIYSVMDADGTIPSSDVLLMVYFGRIAEKDSLERLLESTGRIIYILSHHRGQDTDRRIRRSNVETTEEYLRNKGVHYSRTDVIHDFPQPLVDAGDARRFIARMYGEENVEEYMPMLKAGRGYGYELENRKISSIFDIRRQA